MKIAHIIGARPNIVKMAPVYKSLAAEQPNLEQLIIHSGQQTSENMIEPFFKDFQLPGPDYQDLGRFEEADRASRLGFIIQRLSTVFRAQEPDLIIVYGDVDTTAAGALAGKMLNIPVVHVEAGLRCFDRKLPEETNRIIADHAATVLFCPCHYSYANVVHENCQGFNMMVGNVLADALDFIWNDIKALKPPRVAGSPAPFALLTLHRPSNVDDLGRLMSILKIAQAIAGNITGMPFIFPMHPKTRKALDDRQQIRNIKGIHWQNAYSYKTFIFLLAWSNFVITDSGGVQEEATLLDIPCFTLRPATERPITVSMGTNKFVDDDIQALLSMIQACVNNGIISGKPKTEIAKNAMYPPLWDALASLRIAKILLDGWPKWKS